MWNLDENLKNEPLYVRIYIQIKKMIQEGKYVENEKLPSKRKLAQTLKVSPLTVDQAYQQLIAEGYVYSIEKSGFYVAHQIELIEKKAMIQRVSNEVERKQDYRYMFKTNIVDTSLFPNATRAKLAREVLSENQHEMLNESHPQGIYHLRLEIAKYLEIYRGMKVDANQIIIGSGSTSLITMIVEILGRKSHFAMENPSYEKIYKLFCANDVKLSLIDLDSSGLSVDHLRRSKASIVHITPSHQYPTGIVMPIQRRIELLNWANEAYDRYIIEDDYDSEFRYQGKPIPALEGLDQHQKIIYMNTFTKTLAPSFRISYMVLPEGLMHRYQNISSYHGCTVPNFEQYILYKFMTSGSFERHVNKMKNLYKQKLEIIKNIVDLNPSLHLRGYDAGLHCLLEIDTKENEETIVKRLEKNRIWISVLPMQDKPTLILGYSGIPIHQIKEALNLLIKVII